MLLVLPGLGLIDEPKRRDALTRGKPGGCEGWGEVRWGRR